MVCGIAELNRSDVVWKSWLGGPRLGWGGGFRRRVDLARRGRGGEVGLEVPVAEWPSSMMIRDGRASRTWSLKFLTVYYFSILSTSFRSFLKNIRKKKHKIKWNRNFLIIFSYNKTLAFESWYKAYVWILPNVFNWIHKFIVIVLLNVFVLFVHMYISLLVHMFKFFAVNRLKPIYMYIC